MDLQDILYKVSVDQVVGSTTDIEISNIAFDSRKVIVNGLFVAINGTISDGHQFIDSAIVKGASAIIVEQIPANINEDITYIKVVNSHNAMGIIASNFYNNPSDRIKLVGVTGTNGKTTIVSLLHQLFGFLNVKVGMLSTIQNNIIEQVIPSTHTTPDAIALNSLLAEMVAAGCEYCFMEASSHAIHQNRIGGLQLAGALFTNISHDHLDYHKTFDDYILAKKALFDGLSSNAFALVNKDDKHGMTMLHNCKADQQTYAIKSMADFKCRILENQFEGLLLNLDGQEVWTKLVGKFNAYNLLAIYATAILLGEDKLKALTTLSTLGGADGRFQIVPSERGVVGIVDYAHTPNALKNVLQTIQDVKGGNEQLITILGCGGDRDKTKRPLMAKMACELSNKVILTSDNPRTENAISILEEMQSGIEPHQFKKSLTISERKEAIKTACTLADQGDIILVAGKGHEKYQEINGIKHPFDDVEELKNAFKLLSK